MWQSKTTVYHVYLVADLNVKLLFWIIYKNVPVWILRSCETIFRSLYRAVPTPPPPPPPHLQ